MQPTENMYLQILDELGFDVDWVPRVNIGRLLRLRSNPDRYFEPRLYWNLSRQGLIYFTTYEQFGDSFSSEFWDPAPLDLIKPSDRRRPCLNFIPGTRGAMAALRSLMS